VHVAICGRDEARLAAAVERVGHGCVPIVADVSTPDRASGFVADAAAALGAVDILVPNAGGPPPGNFASTPIDAYPTAIDLNLMSVVAMCKAAVPEMQERRWGRVVAITSLSVRQPMAQLILSNTARAGATAFLKTLALEVAADGVTVNSVQPGLHRTPRIEQLYDDEQQRSMRMGEAADFGQVVAFLCGESAKFTTGLQLHVDGGSYLGLQ
jgi:3-oxoacyl-[acyl-carrier protein] reductase